MTSFVSDEIPYIDENEENVRPTHDDGNIIKKLEEPPTSPLKSNLEALTHRYMLNDNPLKNSAVKKRQSLSSAIETKTIGSKKGSKRCV